MFQNDANDSSVSYGEKDITLAYLRRNFITIEESRAAVSATGVWRHQLAGRGITTAIDEQRLTLLELYITLFFI